MLKKLPLCGLYRHKKMKFWVVQKLVKIEAAELRSRRDRDRLKGNDETESLRPPELAGNRQKNKNDLIATTPDLFPTFFLKNYY